MTLLCIDSGNTRLKWGLRHDGRWLAQGALARADAVRLAVVVPQAPLSIVACNVAGAAGAAAIAEVAAHFAVPLAWVRAQSSRCGVINRYDNPEQLGADRWAALIGARAVHGGACLVVNAGTATTIDVQDAAGVFQGGLILPGLALMRTALAGNTAGLPLAAGAFSPLPRNTDAAIIGGALHATLGAVERMFRHVAAMPGALCLLAGGAVADIEALLAVPTRRVDNLVLEGLARIAETPEAD